MFCGRFLKSCKKIAWFAVLTDESVCPTLVRKGLRFCGAGAFACQPILLRLLTVPAPVGAATGVPLGSGVVASETISRARTIVDDVAQTLSRVFRRHGSRRAECCHGAGASGSCGSPRRRRQRGAR